MTVQFRTITIVDDIPFDFELLGGCMDGKERRLLSASEVSMKLGVCRSKAYEIIRELNREMEQRGCATIPGRVSSQIIEEKYFGDERGVRDDGR